MHKHVWSTVAASALLLAPSPARAQETGFAVNQFTPSERGSDWFVLESLDLRGHLRPSIGVVGDWAYRPLVATDTNGNYLQSIVRDQIFVHPGASLVLWDRLRLAVSVPVQLFANGRPAVLGGTTYHAPANATAVGDVRLGADIRLLGAYGGPFTGAFGFQVSLPTGDRASYTGDGSASVAPRLLIAGDVGPFVYAAKLGVTIRGLHQSFATSHVGHDVLFGASAGLRLLDRSFVIGPEIYGRTVVVDDSVLTADATPVEVLFGAHYKIADAWRVGAGLSAGLTTGFGSPKNRGVLSVEWAPGVPPPQREEDAAPPPPSSVDTLVAPTDRDKDGVLDPVDACPDVPGEPNSDPKVNGCPPSDRDNDGVLDQDDACPLTPGVKTTDPKTNGCPDLDRDKDSVPNDQDACPDTPGPPDPNPKKNGCPKAFVQAGQIKILDQVKFKTASAQILPGRDSQDVLMAVLDVLKSHPEVKALVVEGHTDNRGSAETNKKLSAARAATVVKWLIEHGIDGAMLSSAGVGYDRPIDTNDTEDGRTNNRRVEFHIQNQ
jgi:outer membrane protein OmpA-like peptidoglycan-associated protein